MTTDQSRALCAALGANPDDGVNGEPRYVAVVRVFDESAADKAVEDHEERERATRPPIPARGTRVKTLLAAKGGAK